MEYTPPIVPREHEPSLEPTKPKARRNIFELFKRREDEPTPDESESPESKPKKIAGKSEKLPPASERRRFAADIIMLVRGDTERQRTSPAAFATEKKPMSEQLLTEAAKAEHPPVIPNVETPHVLELASLPLVERAKEMGRGVLKLLGRVKSDVSAADRSERVAMPTNLEPLAVADADVRAAMRELIAPIEEYEATHPQPAVTPEGLPNPEPGEQDTITAAVETGGGDGGGTLLEAPKSSLARTFEVAAAVASVTAREVLETKERYASRVRKIGLFALGAATAGGFAYTWRRMRKLKKEQQAMRKEHKRFEAEVRAAQAKEERRLHELEQTNVSHLTRPERQQFVQEVSEFAHAQAAEIRTTAHTTEVLRPAAEHSVRPRPDTPGAAPETTVFTHRKLERPEKPHGSVFDAPASAERGGIIERLGNVVGAKRTMHETTPAGSGFAGAGSKIMGALTGAKTAADNTARTAATPPVQQPKKYTQAWLLGAALAGSLVLAVLFLTGIL